MPVTNITEHEDGTVSFDFMSENAAVDNIEATDIEAKYYNLQGLEVNPSALIPGIYICRKGSEARRVVVR